MHLFTFSGIVWVSRFGLRTRVFVSSCHRTLRTPVHVCTPARLLFLATVFVVARAKQMATDGFPLHDGKSGIDSMRTWLSTLDVYRYSGPLRPAAGGRLDVARFWPFLASLCNACQNVHHKCKVLMAEAEHTLGSSLTEQHFDYVKAGLTSYASFKSALALVDVPFPSLKHDESPDEFHRCLMTRWAGLSITCCPTEHQVLDHFIRGLQSEPWLHKRLVDWKSETLPEKRTVEKAVSMATSLFDTAVKDSSCWLDLPPLLCITPLIPPVLLPLKTRCKMRRVVMMKCPG